ncbi:glycosyltransferase family 2 protein [Patescibacteria group bacterium]|nr:glycosyltransferase family 2 protein [Patescibacteria group bacterium]MBU1673835.1 glycosyltransferase family 2 protein [Patescibacteria group bacterium]MBU1963608.1 glycosyltransferase family 2 protein [Patescibacteria group bacterium]
MKLSIIIVSWNVKDKLKTCLTSLYKNISDFDFEVIITDNASTDGTPEMVKADFPQAKFIQNKTNLGFGAANNIGLKEATGEYILCLNDDTEIKNNIFPPLFQKFEHNNKLGMIGCQILNPNNTNQESVRKFPTLKDQAVILTKMHNLFPRSIEKYTQKGFDYNKEQEVDQVMGAFMLTKRSVLDEAGLFDERFFLWFEEVDLQKRIHDAGYEIVYTPDASIIHDKGASFYQLKALKAQWNFNKSMLKYFQKHGTGLDVLILILLQPLSLFLTLIVQITKTGQYGKN